MTKKDHELIAQAIQDAKNSNRPLEWVLASRLAGDNPRFNRQKFLEICGPVEKYQQEGKKSNEQGD